MPRLHLIIGPVGSGKSTFARELCQQHRAVRLVLDEWMAVLYGADERPALGRLEWYVERTQRCLDQIWSVTEQLVRVGADVVLELGLIRQEDRARFYARVDEAGFTLEVYVVDAPRALRRERVLRRNQERGETFSMVVPPDFFELASNLWQPPDEDEQRERTIHFMPMPAE